MAEVQGFECPGRYFGRYCTDEREYEYARILERSNEHTLKMLDKYIKDCKESKVVIESRKLSEEVRKHSEESRKLSEEVRKHSDDFRNYVKQLIEQGLIEDEDYFQ